MGYVTLNLSESGLIEGGMFVDAGTEQTRDPEDTLAVTLHEEDLKRGTFVLALGSGGRFVPHTWKADGMSHQAIQFEGTQYGGTLQQFLRSCERGAHFHLVHGWAPSVTKHVPREEFDG